MGCKNSVETGRNGVDINPNHLPPVPKTSWYASPFTEATPMEMSEFHYKNKGHVLFSTARIPVRPSEFALLPNGASPSSTGVVLALGDDAIFGMGYLHNTALFIEHYWRTRVAHTFPKESKFDRPFYDMLLGIKVFINDQLVPDQCVEADSLLQCTATLRAHEATTTWLSVPFVLFWPGGDLKDCSLLYPISLYRSLALSFALAAKTLATGEHDLRVEVVYGCRSEGNFCTDFIARGACKLIVDAATPQKMTAFADRISRLIASSQANDVPATVIHGSRVSGGSQEQAGGGGAAASGGDRNPLIHNTSDGRHQTCVYCGSNLKYSCTVCGASVCGSTSCVWSKFVGYPTGCQTHRAQ